VAAFWLLGDREINCFNGPAYIFGGVGRPSFENDGHLTRFPESHRTAVRVPESFRGGCSFGAGLDP